MLRRKSLAGTADGIRSIKAARVDRAARWRRGCMAVRGASAAGLADRFHEDAGGQNDRKEQGYASMGMVRPDPSVCSPTPSATTSGGRRGYLFKGSRGRKNFCLHPWNRLRALEG